MVLLPNEDPIGVLEVTPIGFLIVLLRALFLLLGRAMILLIRIGEKRFLLSLRVRIFVFWVRIVTRR